jgi:hypothetical protein
MKITSAEFVDPQISEGGKVSSIPDFSARLAQIFKTEGSAG